MKTKQELIETTPVFLNNWQNEDGVFRDFTDYDVEPDAEMMTYNILFASYGTDNYSGDAWVLMEKGGQLFESFGGHCSCNGLEGQFNPECVVLPELFNRIIAGTFGTDDWSGNTFRNELIQFLGIKQPPL